MMAPNRSLIEALREELGAAADLDKASGMQWYMKSDMPYFGVQTPVRRKICRAMNC